MPFLCLSRVTRSSEERYQYIIAHRNQGIAEASSVVELNCSADTGFRPSPKSHAVMDCEDGQAQAAGHQQGDPACNPHFLSGMSLVGKNTLSGTYDLVLTS